MGAELDGFVDGYHRVGVEELYSLGYWPTLFLAPLVRSVGAETVPGDSGIDWGAAACAYEYYLAVMHRYTVGADACVFMMINEPENRFGAWYLPDDLAKLGWTDTFWDDASPYDLLNACYALKPSSTRCLPALPASL